MITLQGACEYDMAVYNRLSYSLLVTYLSISLFSLWVVVISTFSSNDISVLNQRLMRPWTSIVTFE